MCLAGIFVAIELKTDEGKLSRLQRYNLERVSACGGIAIVLTPSNFEQIMVFIKSISDSMKTQTISNEVMGLK